MSNNSAGSNMLSKGEVEAWCSVYGVEGLITVLGNVITILVLIRTPSLHKKTFYLLISLAVADFLVGALALPLLIYVIGGYYGRFWAMTADVNEAQLTIEVFTSFASIYSLTAIALERLVAVMFPMKHSLESKISYISAIVVTWLLALMTGCFVIFYRLEQLKVTEGFFLLIMMLLSLCLLITLVSYIIISVKLLKHRNTSSLPNRERRETQMAVTFLLVSIVFVVTWLPFQVMNYVDHFNFTHARTLSFHYLLATKLLHYFNSLVNPFIYAFRIPEFRKGLKNLFCCSSSTEPTPKERTNGAYHVRGPVNDAYADDDNGVSMTTV